MQAVHAGQPPTHAQMSSRKPETGWVEAELAFWGLLETQGPSPRGFLLSAHFLQSGSCCLGGEGVSGGSQRALDLHCDMPTSLRGQWSPLPSCVILAKLLNLSVPQFSHLVNRANSFYVRRCYAHMTAKCSENTKCSRNAG